MRLVFCVRGRYNGGSYPPYVPPAYQMHDYRQLYKGARAKPPPPRMYYILLYKGQRAKPPPPRKGIPSSTRKGIPL